MLRIRWVAALGALSALAVAGTASAGTFFDNEYQGHAEKDKATYVGFNLNDSKTKLTNLKTYSYFHCPGESGSSAAITRSKARISVDSKGRFKDTVDGDLLIRGTPGGTPENVVIKIAGQLLKHGKAKGTIEVSVVEGGDRCYTGDLDWKAKRGANAGPQIREVGR